MNFSDYVWAKNRPSPADEDKWREAHKKCTGYDSANDGLDISAVVTSSGVYGHGLLDESDNRGRDDEYHRCYHFVSDTVLQYFK